MIPNPKQQNFRSGAILRSTGEMRPKFAKKGSILKIRAEVAQYRDGLASVKGNNPLKTIIFYFEINRIDDKPCESMLSGQ